MLYGFIFLTTCLVNKKIYVGQTARKDPKVKYYKGSGILIDRALKKYKHKNFIRTTLIECQSQQELNEQETFWIEKLDSTNPKIGYNIDKGGKNGNIKAFKTEKAIRAYNAYNDRLREQKKTDGPRLCKIEGCGKKHYSFNLCKKHYNQLRQGKIDSNGVQLVFKQPKATCKIFGCCTKIHAKEMCKKHYNRVLYGLIDSHGQILKNFVPHDKRAERCCIEGCTNKVHAKDLCSNHYEKRIRHAKHKIVSTINRQEITGGSTNV